MKFLVQPTKKGLKEYDFLDTKGYLGRRDVVVGKIVKSSKRQGWFRLILYLPRKP